MSNVLLMDEQETGMFSTHFRIERPEYLIFVVPGSWSQTLVRSFRASPETAEQTIDRAISDARAAGAPGLRWAVSPLSRPADLAERLRARGFARYAQAETLFFDLGSREDPQLPTVRPTPGISTREARDEDDIDRFIELGQTIFGDPPPSGDYLRRFRDEVHTGIRTTGHSELFLVYEGPEPIGRGGMSVTGRLARLWTSGVLASHRQKGAYSLLTRARCEVGSSLGAELAITHAMLGTSGPILKRLGFQNAGPYDYYDLKPSVPRPP